MADIRGMDRGVIDHFSQRRAEIVEALAERRSDSARSAQAAALETRRAKDYSIDGGRLHEQWRARASEHGLGPAEIDGLVGRCGERPLPSGEALRELAGEIAGPGGLTRQASSFDRRAVIQAFAAAHRYGAGVGRLEHLSDRFLESPHVLALEGVRSREPRRRRSAARTGGSSAPRSSRVTRPRSCSPASNGCSRVPRPARERLQAQGLPMLSRRRSRRARF